MIKEIILKNKKIEYNFEIKKVKNINLRIKQDGTISVSAGRRVPVKVIEEFLNDKADFILNALERFENKKEKSLILYFAEDEIKDVIIKICERVYPYYKSLGIKYPQIKFKKLKSRWGSCHTQKGILTFNIYLMYVPYECIEYVVYHEFTHFLEANHSDRFYNELSKVCPEWKKLRKALKETYI